MPYCPKCDMEFIDGITVCSDCGGTLAASKETYEKELKLQKEAEAALATEAAEQAMSEWDPFAEEAGLQEGGIHEDSPRAKAPAPSGVFVSGRQRCEDLRSSRSAFLLVGGAVTLFSAVCWAGIIRLPMSGGSRLFFQGAMTVMGILCLLVAFKTQRSIAAAEERAEEEERCTKELSEWFLASFNRQTLDQELLSEDPTLSGAELELKRFELIQDHLITGQDIPNQAYADFLSEGLYKQLYED